MEKDIFKVAVLQARAQALDFENNMTIITDAMSYASARKADVLLLPECFITGYYFPSALPDALSDDSSYFSRLCDKARELKIGVIATAFTKGREKPHNSAFVIDKKGQVLMKYCKVHTCDFADEADLEQGEGFGVCEFDGVKLGVMICYDREYPESARILMLKGAEIILVPNDCCSMKPRLQALSTRAYENMLGVVMANPPGENGGNSCAYSPICWDENGECVDNTIFVADEGSEGIYIAQFDMRKLRKYRNSEMMGNTFRKVKSYGILLEETVNEPFIRKGQ